MSETDSKNDKSVDANDSALSRLLKLGALGLEMEDERKARVTAAVREDWRRMVAARSRRRVIRRRWISAVAASTLLVLGFLVRAVLYPEGTSFPVDTTPEWLGDTLSSYGDVLVALDSSPAGMAESLAAGRRLHRDSTITSGLDSYAAIRLETGVELRLDSETTVRLDSKRQVTLVSGAVYVDSSLSEDDERSRAIVVATPWGEATDIGTRFEVRVELETITIRVRDGQVELASDGADFDIDSGHELTLNKAGQRSLRTVQPFDSAWAWTRSAGPPFDLHGRTAGELLDWLIQETGWTLRYDHRLSRLDIQDVELRGSIAGLSPTEALDTVLPTLGLDYTIVEGELRLHPPENQVEKRNAQ